MIIIENFYNGTDINPIIGLGKDGSYYSYIASNGSNAISSLSDGVLAKQILDTSVTFNYFPWIVGAVALAGTGVALGSKSKGKSGKSNNSNKKPTDENQNGIDDDQNVANAQAKIDAAKAAKDNFDKKLAEANGQDNIITEDEKNALDGLKGLYDAANKAAKDAIAEVPADMRDQLQNQDTAIDQVLTVPTVNDKNNNGKADTEDALEALKLAETAKNNVVATLGTFGNGISPYEKEQGDKFITTFNEKKREAKAILDLVDPADPKYQGLLDKYNALGDYDLLKVNDHNGNDKPDADDYQDALDKIAKARAAKQLYDQYMREKGRAVDPEEYEQIKAQADIYKSALDDAKIWERSFSHSQSTYGTELKKQLDTFVRDTLDVPTMNDSNSNDVPDSEEVARLVTKLESRQGTNAKGGSLSVDTYYNTTTGNGGSGNGSMFNAIKDGYMGGTISSWNESGYSAGRQINITAVANSQLSVATHFGYEQAKPGANLPIAYRAMSGDNNLLIGGNASGGQNRADKIHSVEFGSGNDTMLVGIGNGDLKVGVYKSGEHIGQMVAKLSWDKFNSSDIEDVDFIPSYFSSGYQGYLAGFKSMNFGAGDDTLVLQGLGVQPDSIDNRGLQGNAGMDTIVLNVAPDIAQKDYGLTSGSFQGFEKIVFKQAGFVQIRGSDLLNDNTMEIQNGKKILRIESEDDAWFGHSWINLGSQIHNRAYAHGDPNRPNFTDNGGTWSKTGTHTEGSGDDEKIYDVYTFRSTTGQEAEVWVYGMFHVV